MLVAVGIMSLYAIGAIGAIVWMHFRPATPDPSPAAIRVNEYLRKGHR